MQVHLLKLEPTALRRKAILLLSGLGGSGKPLSITPRDQAEPGAQFFAWEGLWPTSRAAGSRVLWILRFLEPGAMCPMLPRGGHRNHAQRAPSRPHSQALLPSVPGSGSRPQPSRSPAVCTIPVAGPVLPGTGQFQHLPWGVLASVVTRPPGSLADTGQGSGTGTWPRFLPWHDSFSTHVAAQRDPGASGRPMRAALLQLPRAQVQWVSLRSQ